MSLDTDIRIARQARMRPVMEIARELGIPEQAVELHGPWKAKIRLEAVEALPAPRARMVVVTAMTPTPLGEGKSTTTVGLAQGLNRIGRKAAVCIRQPRRYLDRRCQDTANPAIRP